MELKTCNILGLDILVTDMEKTVNLIEQNIEQLRGKYICVGNVHTTVMAHDDPQYHTVQADAAFVLPDGGPLSGYSRKHGFPEAERVTGPDLMLALFARDNGLKHYFYGSSEETLALLKEKLAEKYPHLQIAGMVSPPFASCPKRKIKRWSTRLMHPEQISSGWDLEHRSRKNGCMLIRTM